MTPAACVAYAHAHNAKTSWNEDRLIIESDRNYLEVNGGTGQLVRLEGYGPRFKLRMRFEKGAFSEELQTFRKSVANTQNAYDPKRPLGSSFEFLLREGAFAQWAEDEFAGREAAFSAWSKFMSMGALDPIDRCVANLDVTASTDFKIPSIDFHSEESWSRAIALTSLIFADDIFPRGSWPWTLLREAGLHLTGNGHYTQDQLLHICRSQEFGPVGILVVASILDRGSAKSATTFVRNCTWQLSPESFRKDYLPLINTDRAVGKVVQRYCEILCAFDSSEIEAIRSELPNELHTGFDAFVKELRRDVDRSTHDAVSAALDAAWLAGWRKLVEERLEEFRDRDVADNSDS